MDLKKSERYFGWVFKGWTATISLAGIVFIVVVSLVFFDGCQRWSKT